jgi:hypothetical protein
MLHWFLHYSGSNNPAGPWYGWWSGAGSDLGEIVLFGAILGVFHHHNCMTKGCWRLGKHVEGTPYVACPKHHPAHQGDKRNVSLDVISDAHREANK